MGRFQGIFPPSPSWTKESCHHRRQRGIHSYGTKHLWCTANTYRRASRCDIKFEYYLPGHADSELVAGRTGTSQFSPYQLKISVHGTIGTYDCDDELHAGATQYFVIGDKKTTNTKRKFYCCNCGRNYTHGSKTWSTNKAGHKEDVYYNEWIVMQDVELGACGSSRYSSRYSSWSEIYFWLKSEQPEEERAARDL